jgi:PAS domain S-box-containing protein
MNNTNILVVEDESLVAKDIQSRLNKFGYTVSSTAASGEEAIKQVTEYCPDLVLMDIQLKGKMGGIETAQKIRSRCNIPVIYLTANANDSTLELAKTTKERARKTDSFGRLLEPFKDKELRKLIKITLAKHYLERKLKQSERWLTTVLKSIGDAVITSDHKGAITFMNPVAEVLTGWKQEDAVGKDVAEVFNIIHADDRARVKNPIVRALQESVIIGISEQSILMTRNGAEIPIDDRAAPIKDEKGNITGAVLVFRDITEFKQAKEARQKQIEQEHLVVELEKINELKDDFLSTVSHELRTPITNMRMAIRMLELLGGLAEQSQRYLKILESECAREGELIDNLLDLQRLETASYLLVLEDVVSLQNYLPSIIESFRGRTQQREQTIQLNLPPNVPPLVTDQASLERILAELLNNACKYTRSAGEIVLSVR